MTGIVGVVIVSHSPKVAEGAADMVRQMVGDEVPCAWTGGDPGGGLGTDAVRIRAAIEQVWSDAGVAVLVDLGGAEMNAEVAIEMLGNGRAAKARICNAPVVEGAVVAATEAAGGATLDRVLRHRRGAEPMSSDAAARRRVARAEVRITHPTGLHARPAVKLTKLAKAFPAASIRLRANPDGGWVDAKSIVKVMALKARTGIVLELEAEGDGGEAAIAQLKALVERDFDEGHG